VIENWIFSKIQRYKPTTLAFLKKAKAAFIRFVQKHMFSSAFYMLERTKYVVKAYVLFNSDWGDMTGRSMKVFS